MTDKGIFIVAEIEDSVIHPITFELLGKAESLAKNTKDEITVLVIAGYTQNYEELFQRGADNIIAVIDKAFQKPTENLISVNLVNVLKKYNPSIVLFGATNFGRALAPHVAAVMGTGLTADCTDLKINEDGKLLQIRPAFSDNILAYITTGTMPQMATVRYKEFPERNPVSEEGEEKSPLILEAVATEYQGIEVEEQTLLGEMDIALADLIVAGGAGIKCKEDLDILRELAAAMGGTLGASRALVDCGIAESSVQVGYSGNRVRPKVYVACGISGAPQHLAGMKESDLIIAINKDPSAPIFSHCHIGYVGDLYKIVPMLTKRIKGGR